jgi:riboflavin biosynthesis pyrimidine reductase
MTMAVVTRIEGFAIVSEDGMLADVAGVMPPALQLPADQRFFEAGLDRADVVVHGAHSQEQQRRSAERRRLIVTGRVAALAPDRDNPRALQWNPAGASLETAIAALGLRRAAVAVIGGTGVFGLFLDRYDAFYLTRGPRIRLPGGRPAFPGVPTRTPEEMLAAHGLRCAARQVLDEAENLVAADWSRPRAASNLSIERNKETE